MKKGFLFWSGIILLNSLLLYTIWHDGIFTVTNLILFALLLLNIIQYRDLKSFLSEVAVLTGSKKCHSDKQELSIKEHLVSSNIILNDLQSVISGIDEIGQPQFSDRLKNIQNNNIRVPLQAAHEKIESLRKKEADSHWVTQGVAEITGLKYNGNDIAGYSLKILSTIVKYLQANHGCFYLLKENEGDIFFELTAAYAYDKRKYVEKRIYPGDGPVGQVYYEKDIIFLTAVPADYIKITSGLGEALPRCVCIIPLLSDGVILGAIEVASFTKLQIFELEYLRRIGGSVGHNLHAMESHRKTETLLNESRGMAQEVKAQEEELRQNMEELTATQEQMRRKQTEMDAVLSSLSMIEIDLHGCITFANQVFLSITGYSDADILNRAYRNLIPEQGNERSQFDLMWSSIAIGQTFSGEFSIIGKEKNDMWMVGNFSPIMDDQMRLTKVIVTSLFVTKEKQKLLEMQDTIAAIKRCFPMAEINPDLTFKSANDLLLVELGIKRLELRKLLLQEVIPNGSCHDIKEYFTNTEEIPKRLEITLRSKCGAIKKFSSTLMKIHANSAQKKGLLILDKSQ